MAVNINENEWLLDKLSEYEKLTLFGTDKATILELNNKFKLVRIFSVLVYREYLKDKYSLPTPENALLSAFIRCILSKDCRVLSGFKELPDISKIFKSRYDEFLDAIAKNKNLGTTLIKRVFYDNKVEIIYSALLDNKNDLYINIDYAIEFIDNCFIKRILSDDSNINDKYSNKEPSHQINMSKKINQKNIALSTKENIFTDKNKLLINSFEVAKTSLNNFLSKQFPMISDEIINQFNDDKRVVFERMSLEHYNSKKNTLYANMYTFLTKNNVNHTLKNHEYIYYPFIHDILLLKYKLITIFRALKVHKIDKQDIEIIIHNKLLDTIQDRKQYYSFFQNITEENQITGYIYRLISSDNESNPIRHILNYKNETKPILTHVHHFSFLPSLLDKSSQIISFYSFQTTPNT